MSPESRRIRMVMSLRRAGVSDARVLGVMERVERGCYVPPALLEQAYDDRPLPIGHGQTISQPAVVGLMLQALDAQPRHRVLEIGVGSGYQTALLSRLCRAVYGIERIRPLYDDAKRRLTDQGVENAFLRWGDGGLGWPESAPFDRIIAAAAANDVPGALADQLKPGGVMVLPLASSDRASLWRIERTESGFATTDIGDAAFVPFLEGASGGRAELAMQAGRR